jgi:hypothetical protein
MSKQFLENSIMRIKTLFATLALVCCLAQYVSASLLVRVDLQAPVNNWGTATGAEPLAIAQSSSFASDGVDFWNTASFQGVFTPPNGPYNLVDSSDPLGPLGSTVAVFTVNTNTVGMTAGKVNQVDPLRLDFWQVTTSTPVEWNISGLVPGGSYEMILYAGMPSFSAANIGALFHLDADGQNGNLELSQVVNYIDGAFYLPIIVADANGFIHGNYGEVPNQQPGTGTWSGFQLSGPSIPEPTCLVLVELLTVAVVPRRCR